MKKIILSIVLLMFLSSCAATQTAISKRNLDVQTKMSSTIFLDPVAKSKRVVFLQVRNTSDKPDFSIQDEIAAALIGKGYKVVDDPNKAYYMLQANVLQVGKVSPSAAEKALNAGYGDTATGAIAGAALGASLGRGRGALAGGAAIGILGAVATTAANSFVKDVTYSIITDIQLSEKAKSKLTRTSTHSLKQGTSGATEEIHEEQSDRKRYQTRVVSTANKVNLKFEEALPELKSGLVRSLSGLF